MMSTDNGKTSKLAITGLIAAVAAPCLFILFIIAEVTGLAKSLPALVDMVSIIMPSLPFIALPLSIAGIVVAKTKRKKGVIPGIVGLILSISEIIFLFVTISVYLKEMQNFNPFV